MTRRSKLKGYRVTKTKSGKTVVEQIPGYGLNVSRKIQQKNSKSVRVTRRAPG